jgi:hypothetical protein
MLNRIALSLTGSLAVCFAIGTFRTLAYNEMGNAWYIASFVILLFALPVWFAVLLRAFVRSCLKTGR